MEISTLRMKIEANKLAPPGLDKNELAAVTQQLLRLQESSSTNASKGGPAGKKRGKIVRSSDVFPPSSALLLPQQVEQKARAGVISR